MNVKLVVVQGKPEGKVIPLRSPRFLIGRGPECHLRPNSELVSRNHSLLTTEGDVIRLRDLGSTNGTIVNGQRITGEVVLQSGDIVQVGPLGFKVMLETAVEAAEAVSPVPAAAQAASPPMPEPSRAGKLGAKDAKESDIEQWLLSDAKHEVPDSGSGVYNGDTQMLEKTSVEQAAHTDTKTDIAPPDVQPAPVAEPEPAVPTSENGLIGKPPAPKKPPQAGREDASRVAADLLRRMMERRPRGD